MARALSNLEQVMSPALRAGAQAVHFTVAWNSCDPDFTPPMALEPHHLVLWARRAGLVGVDFRQPGVISGIGGDQAVDVREAEEPADAVHHRFRRGVPQPRLVQLSDVELKVRPLNAGQRVETIGLTVPPVMWRGLAPIRDSLRHREFSVRSIQEETGRPPPI